MDPLNQVNIEEKETIYDIKTAYHSDKKCQNYDAVITGVEEANGSVTIRPWGSFPTKEEAIEAKKTWEQKYPSR